MLDDSFRLVCQLLEGLPAQVFRDARRSFAATFPFLTVERGFWIPMARGLVHQFTIDDFTHQLGFLDKCRIYPDAPVVDLLVQGIRCPLLLGERETA